MGKDVEEERKRWTGRMRARRGENREYERNLYCRSLYCRNLNRINFFPSHPQLWLWHLCLLSHLVDMTDARTTSELHVEVDEEEDEVEEEVVMEEEEEGAASASFNLNPKARKSPRTGRRYKSARRHRGTRREAST